MVLVDNPSKNIEVISNSLRLCLLHTLPYIHKLIVKVG